MWNARRSSVPRLATIRSCQRRGLALVTALALGAAAAGCGSTVETASSGSAEGGSLEFGSTGAPSDRASATTDVAVPGSGEASGAAPTGGGGAGVSATLPGDPSGTGAAGGPVAVGHGITDTEISVGIWYVPADADAGELVGVSAANAGIDGRAQAQAVVDHVNSQGGIAGRMIAPSYYELSSAEVVTPEGRAREAQRMCAQWTEDAHVFAMVAGSVGYDEGLVECAVSSQTPYIVPFSQYYDEEGADAVSPFLYVLSGFTVERREQAIVQRLAARGFFADDARVGLMIEGLSPAYAKGVERGLKPALEQLGVEVVAEVVYPDWITSPWPNYVLQFQQRGVTHVLFTATSGLYLPPALFMRSAEAQLYRPNYGGIGSDQLPNSLAENAPASHLRNVTAVGWLPSGDISSDSGPISARDDECRRLMVSAGQPEWNPQGHAYCDAIFFLRDGLQAAPELTPAGLAAAVDSYGTSWPSAVTWATRFGPGRHDGADTVRDLSFDEACTCFVYTGEPVPAG